MEQLSGTLIKGYELRDRIGAGGFGAVYRAFQSTVGREVAIKIILPGLANQPEFVRRFEAEAQVVARLEHMNITPLYDYWRDPEGAYLVMRYLRGGSLQTALRDDPYDLESVARLLDQVASALAVAHRNQVIHRDIKPANILLDEDGNGYVADFGLAKDLDNGAVAYTQAGDVVGTPDYLSPEQVRNEPVTPRSDIYSLGLVLYEMLTAAHPFPESTPVERLFKHLNEPTPRIASLDKNVADAINAVIQKATAKNPAQRYKDVLALAAAFREAAGLSVSQAAEKLVELLTPREQEVLELIIDGKSNREIGEELTIELSTVKWYVTQIYRKLNVRSRVQAIVRARELDLIVDGGATDSATISRISALPEPENPYKGLQAFQIADEQDFFGREKLVQKLLSRLGQSGDYSRFLAVVGPSGSGKSSLVRAGLIPALWRGDLPGSERWYITDLVPGPHPLDELEVALIQVAANRPDNLGEQLARDERGLVRAAQIILPDDDSELVIVIDQFEEIFTLVENEADRVHFLELLHQAVIAPRSRVRLVITLRADFYDRPLQYPTFGELVRSRMETVLPLNAGELEQAIVGPAQRVGVRFEDGLVAAIVSDINYQPGALPLLQFALTELFEAREQRILTRRGYDQIGRAAGALAKRAEQLYLELDESGREAVRQMLLRLVTLGEGSEDTRRRVARSELLAVAQDADLMDEVIDTFATYRLLALDHDPASRSPTVEVAHEALLREWDRLRQWLDESRADIRLQRLLAAAATEWLGADRDPGFLLRDARLDQFEGWAGTTNLALTEKERLYLEASIEARQKREADEAARLQRELETARKLAEAERVRAEEQSRAAGKLRQRAVFLGAALVIAGLLAVVAVIFAGQASQNEQQAVLAEQTAEARRQQAETAQAEAVTAQLETKREARRARASQLAAQAQLVLENNEDPSGALPLLLAREAVLITLTEDAYFTPEADAALRRIADTVPILLKTFSGHTDSVVTADFSADGKTLATGSNDKTIRLWDVDTGQELQRLQGHTLKVWSVDFSPDGKTLVSASPDRTVRLWDVATGAEIRRFEDHTGRVNWAIFSPDGTTIATSGSGIGGRPNPSLGDTAEFDDTIRLWDVASGKEIKRIAARVPAGVLSSLVLGGLSAYSPDGKTLVTSGEDHTARLWDVATGAEIRRFEGHTAAVAGAVFSPDGKTIVTASDDHTFRLWDVATGAEIRRFDDYTGAVRAANFSPDGQTIIASSFDPATERFDRIVRLWDVATGAETYRLASPTAGITFATFSPDGHSIVTISESPDNTVRLWAAKPKGEIRRLEANSPIRTVAVSPDGQTIVTAGANNRVRLWDAATGEEITQLQGHTGRVNAVAFSPNTLEGTGGQMLASAGFDKTIRLWDVATSQEIKRIENLGSTVLSLAFSPDGQTIATASEDKIVRLWDVNTGQEIQRFAGHTASVNSVAFRSDGQTIATGGADKTVRLWDVETGEEIRRLEGHTSIVRSVDFSPDGQTLVSAGTTDTTVRLWDVERGREIGQFEGHKSRVNVAIFSPNGQTVVSAGKDGSVLVWDVDSRSVIRRLHGHTSYVFAAAFSPDGQLIVTAGHDRTARIWPSVRSLLAEAESLIQRDPPEFTPEERVRFGLSAR